MTDDNVVDFMEAKKARELEVELDDVMGIEEAILDMILESIEFNEGDIGFIEVDLDNETIEYGKMNIQDDDYHLLSELVLDDDTIIPDGYEGSFTISLDDLADEENDTILKGSPKDD
jgi:hypothetical protein